MSAMLFSTLFILSNILEFSKNSRREKAWKSPSTCSQSLSLGARIKGDFFIFFSCIMDIYYFITFVILGVGGDGEKH